MILCIIIVFIFNFPHIPRRQVDGKLVGEFRAHSLAITSLTVQIFRNVGAEKIIMI